MEKIVTASLRSVMRDNRICVIVPTYNNAGTLEGVINDISRYCDDIIVVNDGSTDATPDILARFGDTISVVSYPANRGKGFALREGFRYAISKGFDYAITIDSDGQHFASDIPAFVKAVLEYPDSIIVGERDLSNVDINRKSSFANKFSNFWFHLQTGKSLQDTQTGYRAYPLRNLHGLSMLTSRYEAELMLLVMAAWNGVRIHPIPIRVYYPPQSERVSHFRPAKDFTRISILNTFLCIGALIYGLPMRIYTAIRDKKVFNRECRFMTRKKDEKKEAATTLDRLFRSLYGLSFFLFWSLFIFAPYTYLSFRFGKPTEQKRLRLHRRLQRLSKYIVTHYPGGKTVYENVNLKEFDRPAMIVCNHQSQLDLPLLMALHPKLIFLTNDWVWHSPFFGSMIRQAEFLPVSAGIEKIIPHLSQLVERGYSIVVFPEGTRSADCRIRRFHQGAFHIASQLNLDIIPAVIHGAGHYLPKNDFMFRRGLVTLRLLDRIPQSDLHDLPLMKQAAMLRKKISEAYSELEHHKEKARYFTPLISYKYAWRGWNCVTHYKSFMKCFDKFEDTINAESPVGIDPYPTGNIAILNSGIGVFALYYALVNKGVQVYAFESDIDKHRIAVSTPGLPSNLHFIHAVFPEDIKVAGTDIESWDKVIRFAGPLKTDNNNSSVIEYGECC